jgi:hypothetical protein
MDSTTPTHHIQSVITHPQLIVQGNTISNYQMRTLRTHSREKEATEYLKQKNSWSTETFRSIQWPSHGKALQQLPARQRKSVIQFIHNWLPINTSHSLQFTTTARLCPLCNIHEETIQHFLTCAQVPINQLWSEHALSLKKKLIKYSPSTHHHLSKLIEYAIVNWRDQSTPDIPDFLHTRFHPLFVAQSEIGWHHILKGRFSSLWLACISPDYNLAQRWLTYAIKHIWNLWYIVWKYRCDTNQGDNPTTKDIRLRQRLLPQVQQLYDAVYLIDPSDSYIFKSSQEDLLLQQPRDIKKWVRIARLRIKESVARTKQKIKHAHLPIHHYFLLNKKTNDLQKNKRKPLISRVRSKTIHQPKASINISRVLSNYFLPLHYIQPTHTVVHTNNDLFPP